MGTLGGKGLRISLRLQHSSLLPQKLFDKKVSYWNKISLKIVAIVITK